MSVLVAAVAALVTGILSLLLRWRFAGAATALGAVGLVAVIAIGLSIRAEDVYPVGDTTIAGSDAIRRLAVLWALSALGLTAVDAVSIRSHAVAGPALVGIGATVLALAVPDAGTAFCFLAAGGVVAVLAPAVAAARPRASVAWLALRATVIAASIGLGLVAWGASAIGPLSGPPLASGSSPAFETAVGLGLVAIGAAVGLRMGTIPTHVWAARLVEAIPAPAIPAALAWGGAAFALVGLGWTETTIGSASLALPIERAIVLAIAAASILLGAVAAFLHDDLEHVLGYSLVQDAGIVLLAFVVVEPGQSDTVMTWVLAYAAAKSALAAFISVIRSIFGTRRLADLGGWARSAPILGVGLVLATIAAVGFPGTAAYDARLMLISGAASGPFGQLLLLGALSPIAYLGRIAWIGCAARSDTVRGRHARALPLRSEGRSDRRPRRPSMGTPIAAATTGDVRPIARARAIAAVAVAALARGAMALRAGGRRVLRRIASADQRDRETVAATFVAVLGILAATVSLAGA